MTGRNDNVFVELFTATRESTSKYDRVVKRPFNVNVNVELRWHFTNKSVTGAPYSIKSHGLLHSCMDTMVKSLVWNKRRYRLMVSTGSSTAMRNFTWRFKDMMLACDNVVVSAAVSLRSWWFVFYFRCLCAGLPRAFLLSFVLLAMDHWSDANKWMSERNKPTSRFRRRFQRY